MSRSAWRTLWRKMTPQATPELSPAPAETPKTAGLPKGFPDWGGLTAGSAAWARRQPGRRGRVLIATNIGGHGPVSVFESTLAASLALRDAEVEIVLCDAALPACLRAEYADLPDDSILTERRLPQTFCPTCMGRGRAMFEPLGLKIRFLSELITEEDRAEARGIAGSLPADQIDGWLMDGLKVGEHAYAGALRYYTRGDLEGEARGEEVLRRYLEAAILSVKAYRRLLSERRYDVALFHHGLYVPQGPVGEVCREAGVRVVNWVVAYRSNSFILSEGDTYHHTLMTEPVSDWRDMAWGERQKREITAYLKSRWRGDRDWIGFHEKPEEDAVALAAALGLDLSKPVIGMLSNVVWDAQLHYPANAFPSLIDWAARTIDYFKGRPDLQLLLRIHPAEVRGTSRSRQPLLAEIDKRFPDLPPNVFIIPPESPVSTYAAMAFCDSVLIYGTKTGVELTAVGIPVVVAGEAWIKNKGLTLDASTPEAYFRILDSLPLMARLRPEVVEQAQKYAYHFFFRRMMPLPFLEKVSSNLFFTPNIASADELGPGRSEALDIVCEAILDGGPFVYPAERLGVHDLPAEPGAPMNNPAKDLHDRAMAAIVDHQLVTAVGLFQEALAHPQGTLLRKERRMAHAMSVKYGARLGDWAGVEAAALGGLGEFPDNPLLLQGLGEALIQLGRLDEAETALNRALEVNPEQDGARALLAMTHVIPSGERKTTPRVRGFPNRTAVFDDPTTAIRRYLLRDRPKAAFIRPDTAFLTMGSCFAQNLASRLRAANFTAHAEEVGEEVNSTYANRYLLEWVEKGAVDGPTSAMDRAYGPGSRERLRRAFASSQVFVMTLGLAACFFDHDGRFVFIPQHARTTADALADQVMRTTTVAENVENIGRIVDTVRRLSGHEMKIVLTVSPVPLAGTTEFESAIVADCISKSTLRLACQEVVSARAGEGVFYWPSFEIVRWLGPHFGPDVPRVYGGDDLNPRHVSKWLVDLIVREFLEFHAEKAAWSSPLARPVVVALNALINPANAGGSESSALSILTSFRDSGPPEIDMLVTALGPYAGRMAEIRGDAGKVITWPWPEFTPVSCEPTRAWARRLRGRLGRGAAGRMFDDLSRAENERTFLRTMPDRAQVDALLDRHGVDVAHFTYPVKWPTRRPFIFEPHDIQQHHFPEFFSPDVLAWRKKTYGEGIRGAAFVVCGTWWTKRDIMRWYGVGADKVAVIPRSSAMGRAEVSAADEARLAAEAGLGGPFMFYPAMTFPHKNHLRLFEAMARLRDERGLALQLVCTGRAYGPFHPKLEAAVRALGLEDQVRFLGVVSDELLAVCYRRARFVVFPSLLEGHSQSLLEALWHGRAIVAAGQSSIPETIGGAGLLFDGESTDEMAAALAQAWTDDGLIAELEARAPAASGHCRWDRAILALTACYKSAAGRPLGAAEQAALDRALLAERPED